MEKNVIISIRGLQSFEQTGEDCIELVTEGRLADHGEGGLILSYQESELTGMEGTETILHMDPDGTITLLRTGQFNSQMIFQEGVEHNSLYQMPFGALMLSVKATRVFFDIVPDGGVIDLSYDISIENSEAGVIDYHLDIRAK